MKPYYIIDSGNSVNVKRTLTEVVLLTNKFKKLGISYTLEAY